MTDLKPWACTCGERFADSHDAITVEMVNHTRGSDHVIRKQPRTIAALRPHEASRIVERRS